MTIAFRPQQTRYVPLSEKERREAAQKEIETAGGDTNRLLMTPEERARKKADAEQIAAKKLPTLTPEEVWKLTVKKVSNMANEGVVGLLQTFPEPLRDRFRPVKPTERPIKSVARSPHSGLTMMGTIFLDRGREIQLYCSNVRGTMRIVDGTPQLVDIHPSDEKTQSSPRYFGTSVQRLPNGKRDTSPQLIVTEMTNINDVTARCCELFDLPAPTKRYEYQADKKARLEAEKRSDNVVSITAAPKPAPALTAPRTVPKMTWDQGINRAIEHAAPKSNDNRSIMEIRAAAQAAAAQYQPTPSRAYGM